MDTFAAIALSTEPPVEKILQNIPSRQILTAPIIRQVIGISMWKFLVMIILFLFGEDIASLPATYEYWGKLNEAAPDGGNCGFKDLNDLKAKVDAMSD